MPSGGLVGGQYQPLIGQEIERIHEAGLRILESTGTKVHNQQSFEVFEDQGAIVDKETRTVKIPRSMVEEALASAPSRVTLCGRQDEHDLILEDRRVYLGTGGTAVNVLDLDGMRRQSILKDVAQLARLVDALDNIHFYVLPVYPHDLPKEKVDVNRFYAGLSNTSKHVMGGIYTREGTLNVIRMAEEIAGGAEHLRKRALVSFITCLVSPLMMDDHYGGFLLEVAKEGLPVVLSVEPLCGATAPVTLAGNLTLWAAEVLSGVVLTQLVNPGTPAIAGYVGTITDMRTMGYLAGPIEAGLLSAGAAQLSHFWEIPLYATAGMSDSLVPDSQAGYESALTTLLVALSGANFVHDAAGLLEFALTASYEKYVIDNEINGMVMRALQGIEMSDDAMATDVIQQVGPGGDFVGERHTVKHMRSEFFFPLLANRKKLAAWEAAGSKDARERANEIAREILTTHEPLPIPGEVKARVGELLGVAEVG
jgi:trimethylamine--corrinoid protein Co-methyltransferase